MKIAPKTCSVSTLHAILSSNSFWTWYFYFPTFVLFLSFSVLTFIHARHSLPFIIVSLWTNDKKSAKIHRIPDCFAYISPHFQCRVRPTHPPPSPNAKQKLSIREWHKKPMWISYLVWLFCLDCYLSYLSLPLLFMDLFGLSNVCVFVCRWCVL